LSSGLFEGIGTIEMLAGSSSFGVRCQPAWSMSTTAWAPGATCSEISARCRFRVLVLQNGSTRPAALPSCGQIAPKM